MDPLTTGPARPIRTEILGLHRQIARARVQAVRDALPGDLGTCPRARAGHRETRLCLFNTEVALCPVELEVMLLSWVAIRSTTRSLDLSIKRNARSPEPSRASWASPLAPSLRLEERRGGSESLLVMPTTLVVLLMVGSCPFGSPGMHISNDNAGTERQ